MGMNRSRPLLRRYANRHRLPRSLQDRFLTLQVGEFPESELPSIICQRREQGQLDGPPMDVGQRLAALYHALLGSACHITMREGWSSCFQPAMCCCLSGSHKILITACVHLLREVFSLMCVSLMALLLNSQS